MSPLIDVSVPIHAGLPTWPGDPGVCIEQTLHLAHGDPANVSMLHLGAHTGTHVDAFSHFTPDGAPMHRMDLDVYVGPALVLEVPDTDAITRGVLREHPRHADLCRAERVLFKTRNSRMSWHQQPFQEDFCHLSPDGADYLTELSVRLVGIDYLSVEGFRARELYGEDAPTHHRLIRAGIYIVEGLLLADVAEGWYELLCMPLNIHNGDGSPARVALRPLANNEVNA